MRKKTDLEKFLKELDREELAEEIRKLYDKFEAVRVYYQIDLSGNIAPFLAAAKKKIAGMFYWSNGKPRRPKASRLNTVAKDFEQISIFKDDLIDLHLYRVEQTVQFINEQRYHSEQLEASTLRAYRTACTLTADHHLKEKFRARCRAAAELPDNWDLKTAFADVFNELLSERH